VSHDPVVTGILEGELIAVNDVVKEGPKDSTPGVLGALLFPLGKGSKKRENLFRGKFINSRFFKLLSESAKHEPVGNSRIFFPNWLGDTPGMHPLLVGLSWFTSYCSNLIGKIWGLCQKRGRSTSRLSHLLADLSRYSCARTNYYLLAGDIK
jgi:hypothetical protein